MADIVLLHVSERSVLEEIEARGLVPFRLGERKRFATCSGVAWFRGHHLAVVNLYGGHLRVYRFHPGDEATHEPARLALLHETSEGISFPEDVAVSPDGNLLAISHSMSDDHGISIHPLDAMSLAPGTPGQTIRRGRAFHCLNFSPDSRHLAFTEVSTPGSVEVIRVASTAGDRTCLLANKHAPMKPKGIAFSSDGRFVAIGRSAPLTPLTVALAVEAAPLGAMYSVYRFDAANGVISADPVAELTCTNVSLGNVEMCTFLPTSPGKPYRILGANQAADTVTEFEFDAEGRTLSFAGVFAAGMSFPHGIDASADGRFVAVTNYGDDTLRVARVAPDGW
jgi:hypothetical protein